MGTTNYPNGLDDFAGASPPNLGDNDVTGRKHAKRHDDIESAMEAVQAELGTNPSGSDATVAARFTRIEAGGTQGPAGPTGPQGPAGPTGPTGSVISTWKGAWDSGTAYIIGDIVENVGSSYIAVAPSTGVIPNATHAATWEKMSSKGAEGPEGPQGPAGATGPGVHYGTTAPASPFAGQLWSNPSTEEVKQWNGTAWVDPSNAGGGSMAWAIASGGSESTVGGDKVHQFAANGALTVTRAGMAQILVVGPGSSTSGNGNGGPVMVGTVLLEVGTYSVVVGVSATGQGASDWTSTRLGKAAGAGVARGVADRGDDGASASANGVVSDITGTSREYGAGGSRKATLTNAADRYGIGGDPAISNRAGGGFVAVRYTL